MSVRQKEDRPPFTQEQVAWIRGEIARMTQVELVIVDRTSEGVPITPMDRLPSPPPAGALQVPITEAMIVAGIDAYCDEEDPAFSGARRLVIEVFKAMCAASATVLFEAKT